MHPEKESRAARNPRNVPLQLDSDTHAEFARMARGGASWAELGRLAGCSWAAARAYAEKNNVVTAGPRSAAGAEERAEGTAAKPAGHPDTWGAITSGTELEGVSYLELKRRVG